MPCFGCGARQTDPARGDSPWRRGVRADRQVLVCPDCQREPGWAAALDRCESCGSAALISRLEEVECRDCGHIRPAAARPPEGGVPSAPGLSDEVAAALTRLLNRPPR